MKIKEGKKMLKKRISKVIFALVCIASIVMPYGMPVFAAISHEDTSVNLTVVRPHEGGEESSGTLASEYVDYYDENSYQYAIDRRPLKTNTLCQTRHQPCNQGLSRYGGGHLNFAGRRFLHNTIDCHH